MVKMLRSTALQIFFLRRGILAGKVICFHKVSPQSTDPVPLYGMYSKLQNVNKVFLDSRLRPTLSCLVAKKILRSATFLPQQQSQADLIV